MLVYDALSRSGSYKKWEGTYGVEIETETDDEYRVPEFSLWEVHNDGSLRGFGKEYVLKQPLKFGTELDSALQEFKTKTEKIPFRQNSISTSVHVHINMLNETFRTMCNFLTVYTMVENILIRYCGEDRKSSLFCLPICDAEETAKNIRSMFTQFDKKNYKFIANFSEANCKYAALNLASLYRIGSLEIRSFRGTPNTSEIKDWVGILNSMMSYARQDIKPPEIIASYHERGGEVLSEIFGPYREQLRYIDETLLIKKTLFWATVNAHAVKDWTRMDEEPKKATTKKNFDLDKISRTLFNRPFNELNLEQQEAAVVELERLVSRNPFDEGFEEGPLRLEAEPRVGGDNMVGGNAPRLQGWQNAVMEQAVWNGNGQPLPDEARVEVDPLPMPEEDED